MIRTTILLSIQEEYQNVLCKSSVGEIERIRERLSVGDTEYLLRKNVRIGDVIAYGKALQISERECKLLIPTKITTWDEGYKCYSNPHSFKTDEEYVKMNIPACRECDHIHLTAFSSWACAWQALGEPEFALLIKISMYLEL